jgi:hypothetical protein
MITKEEFVKYISSYQKFGESVERLEKSITGKNNIYFIFETDWCEAVGKMLDVFLDSNFTDYGIDWISYFLWEDVNDKAAYVKQEEDMFNEEKEIRYPLDTIDELWDFLLTDKKLYFKNAE